MKLRLALEAGSDTVQACKELGIKGVPIDAADLAAKGPEPVVAPLAAEGLAVCQIGAFGYNPLHPDAAVLDEQTQMLMRAIPLARATGCPYLVINGGNLHASGFGHGDAGNFTDEALDIVAQRLKPICTHAEEHGAIISIEPYIKSAICSPERFLRLAQLVQSPALKINLDVTNFYDLHSVWDTASVIRQTCRDLAGHYGLVHIKDICLKEGFHIHMELCPIDQGPTDWELLLREAAPFVPEESWVVLEHVASLEEAHRSVAFLRSAAENAGVELA